MPPLDRMDPEAYPFPRRYQFTTINLRNTYRSYAAPGAATNLATHALFNGSSGDRVLVVRGFTQSGTTGASIAPMATQRGVTGTHAGTEFPLWSGERQPAGQHWYQDTANALVPQQLNTPATSNIISFVGSVPLAVLRPGWSFVWQGNAAALTVIFQWIWEELPVNDPILGVVGAYG